MPVYALLIWLAVGAAIGAFATRLLKSVGSFGTIGDLVVGAVGAIIGGYALGLFGGSGGSGIIVSVSTAAVGAFALLWTARKVIKAG